MVGMNQFYEVPIPYVGWEPTLAQLRSERDEARREGGRLTATLTQVRTERDKARVEASKARAEANAAALKALVAGAWRKQALALREAIDQGTPTWAVQRCACPGCTAGYVGVIARLKAAPDALDRQLTEARREAATLLAEVAQLRDRRPLMDVERAAAQKLAAKLRRQLDRLDEVVS